MTGASVMVVACGMRAGWRPAGRNGAPRDAAGRGGPGSHMLVVRILADVADVEDHGLGALVFPPVRRALGLGPDLALLMQDRDRAVARIFVDLALRDEDQRRAVVVAVPRHDAAGLDGELAEAQLAALRRDVFVREIDRAERRIGHAVGRRIDRRAYVRLLLIRRAAARERGAGDEQ